jgi:hypothetical protein
VTKLPVPFAVKGQVYLDEAYVTETFRSCKHVSTGSLLVMDIFCGKWKSAGCSPRRWFDYVGKADTGVVAYDLKVKIMIKEEAQGIVGFTPLSYNTTRCEQAPPVRSEKLTFLDKMLIIFFK